MQSDATADVDDGKGRLGGECDSDLSDVSRERERTGASEEEGV